MDIDRLTINRVLSHLISTELEHMWLIDFKCTSLNFSVIFQLHNYWFFAIFRTQCRTSNIEPNTEGISELFASNKPIFCCTQECSGWCMWLNSSYITHWMFFFLPPECETERLAAWPWSRRQRHIADISTNRCQLPVRWLACGTLDDNL